MQFQIPLALLALLVGIQAAPSHPLEARFKVTGTATFCAADGAGPFGANTLGCADVISPSAGATQLVCVQAQTATTAKIHVSNPNDSTKSELCASVPLIGSSCGATDGSFAVITTITPPGQEPPKTCAKAAAPAAAAASATCAGSAKE